MTMEPPPRAKVIAIDPGPHTGIAIRLANDQISVHMDYQNPKSTWNRLILHRPEVLVVERFVTAGTMNKDRIMTIELVGSIYAMAHVLQSELVTHVASVRDAFMPQAREMLRGQHATDHHRDALAHLLAWEYRNTNQIPNPGRS